MASGTKVFIYALCEPGTRTIRYIGKTKDMEMRLRQHLRISIKLNTHLGHWLSRLVSKGKKPKIICLAKVDVQDWEREEIKHILSARQAGRALVNGTDGGQSGPTDARTNRSRSKKMSGKNNPNFGKPHSPSQRRHNKIMSENPLFLGKKHTEKTKALLRAIAIKRMGKKNPFFGKRHTVKSRARMSTAAKKRVGKKNHFFGWKHTAKSRARMSASVKKWWTTRKNAV